jgi:hypothetical protein
LKTETTTITFNDGSTLITALTMYKMDNGHNIIIVGTWNGSEGTKETYTTEKGGRRLKARIKELNRQMESLRFSIADDPNGDRPDSRKIVTVIDTERKFLEEWSK